MITASRAVVTALAVVVTLGACSRSGSRSDGFPPSTPPRTTAHASTTTTARAPSTVEVWGDSLALQSAAALRVQGHAHHLAISVFAYGGLAPCDLARDVSQTIARTPPPAALVLAFTGNNFSPCMQKDGHGLTGAAYFASYQHALDPLVAAASARGIPVLLLGAATFPAAENHPDRVTLNALYARIAAAHAGARYVPLIPELSPDGFARVEPCLAGETVAIGCRGGLITVRSGNGIHLDLPRTVPCPSPRDTCSYSAGARRYADTVIGALATVSGLSYLPAPATAGVPIDITTDGA